MPDELKDIQTSVIDRLLELKKQREVVEKRLAQLEKEAEKASASVVERVRSDYREQEAALIRSAAPLKAEAAQEFARLARLLDSTGSLVTSVRQDMEEVELRHRLGEFDNQEFQERAQQAAEALALREAELEQMEEIKMRFLTAVDSEEELSVVLDGPLPPPPPPPLAEEADAPPPDSSETARSEPAEGAERNSPLSEDTEEASEVSVQVPPTGDQDFGGTVVLQTPVMKAVSASATAGTVIIPTILARLVAVVADGETGDAFQLQPLTSIGRTDDNQVCIDQSEVSRSHAEITFTASGYLLRDLGSENGTYVNGERIEQVLLEDGDRIQIGSRRFVLCDG